MSLIKNKRKSDTGRERTLIMVGGLIPAIILISFYTFMLQTMTVLAAPNVPDDYVIEVNGAQDCRQMNPSNQMARLMVAPAEEFRKQSDPQNGVIIKITDPPESLERKQSFSETDCIYCHTLHGPNATGQLNPALTYWGHSPNSGSEKSDQ